MNSWERLAAALQSPSGTTYVRRAVWVVLVLAVVAFVIQGANSPPDPSFDPPSPSASGGPTATSIPLAGFSETALTVQRSDGGLLTWCLWVAQTEAERAQGLMEVTDPDLGGKDGMLFRFEADTTNPFYMRNTPMPLSIGFVAADASFVSATDMAPCENVEGCPLYYPNGPYRFAIEVPQGGLARLGIEPGSVITDERRSCA